jgi:hypothetical protein
MDPFDDLALAPAVLRAMPPHSDRFAPLLGMLQAELRGSGHAIDFLHPRRRPEPVNRRKLWISLAAAAAALLLIYIIYGHVEHAMLAAEVDGMAANIASMDKQLKDKTPIRLKAAEIRKWTDQEIDWLDKLDGLARGLPSAREVRLSELVLNSGQRGSQMDFKGWTRRYETIAEMEEGVRPLVGKINTKDSHEDSLAAPYAWQIDVSVVVEKSPGTEAAKAPPAAAKPSGNAAAAHAAAKPAATSAAAPAPAKPSGTGAASAAPPKPSGTGAAPPSTSAAAVKPAAKSSSTGAAP